MISKRFAVHESDEKDSCAEIGNTGRKGRPHEWSSHELVFESKSQKLLRSRSHLPFNDVEIDFKIRFAEAFLQSPGTKLFALRKELLEVEVQVLGELLSNGAGATGEAFSSSSW